MHRRIAMNTGRTAVLVTGACGFVGTEVVRKLLEKMESFDEEGGGVVEEEEKGNDGDFGIDDKVEFSNSELNNRYTHIICLDISMNDDYIESFNSHCKTQLLPMRCDLSSLIDRNSSAYSLFVSTLQVNNVGSIIHTAAVVDTREMADIREVVKKVNVDATLALFDAARDSREVSRFVHISSASAVLERCNSVVGGDTLAQRLMALFLPSSMLTNMPISTYGQSKREAEIKLLDRYKCITDDDFIIDDDYDDILTDESSMELTEDWVKVDFEDKKEPVIVKAKTKTEKKKNKNKKMALTILRPHVVWGRGDPMATEMLLSWPKWLFPLCIVGDPSHKVTGINARLLAEYILLADFALSKKYDNISSNNNSNNNNNNNNIYFKNKNNFEIAGKILNIGDTHESFTSLYNRLTGQSNASIYSIPTWLSCILVYSVQALDALLPRSKTLLSGFFSRFFPDSFLRIFRVLTPNNLAYMTRGLLDDKLFVTDFPLSCKYLFQSALNCVRDQISSVSSSRTKIRIFDNEDSNVDAQYQNWLKKANPNPDLTLSQNTSDLSSKVKIQNIAESRKNLVPTHFSIAKFQRLSSRQQYHFVRSHTLSQSWTLGHNLVLRNRVIKAATFESMCDRRGIPSNELVEFHTRVIQGGAAMTIVAYASVSKDGRSFHTQICLDAKADPGVFEATKTMLKRLVESCHTAGGKVCIQLTHAGAFADPACNYGLPAKAPDAIFNPLTLSFADVMSGEDKSRIEADFVRAIDVCKEIGFDAVEIHLGHGYLLSQCLSGRTNPKFAHLPEMRLAFPLRIVKAVCARAHNSATNLCSNKSAVKEGSSNNTATLTTYAADDTATTTPTSRWLAVLVKYNISEQKEEDLPLADCVLFTRAFYEAGADLLVPSGGQVMINGLHMLRGGAPVAEMAAAQKNIFKANLLRWLGRVLVPAEKYSEAFFRNRSIQVFLLASVPLSKMCLIGGIQQVVTALAAVDPNTGLGVGAVQMGRSLLADPDYCRKAGILSPQTRDNNVNVESEHSEIDTSSTIYECDQSNRCIVGATMALEPLRCTKHACAGVGSDL